MEGVELLLEAEERLWRPGTRAVTKLREDLTVAAEGPYYYYFLLNVPEGSLLIKPVPYDLGHLVLISISVISDSKQ